MPLYDYRCCNYEVKDVLRRSYAEAQLVRPRCPECDDQMDLVDVVRVSFTAFKPFRSSAFSETGQEIEISDASQLRALCRKTGMRPVGDKHSRYFGSNPKSVPSWKEVCTQGKSGVSEKTKKFVREGKFHICETPDKAKEKWGEVKARAERTDNERRDAGQVTRTWMRK